MCLCKFLISVDEALKTECWSFKIFDNIFKFLIKNWVLSCPSISRTWLFWPPWIRLSNLMTPENLIYKILIDAIHLFPALHAFWFLKNTRYCIFSCKVLTNFGCPNLKLLYCEMLQASRKGKARPTRLCRLDSSKFGICTTRLVY